MLKGHNAGAKSNDSLPGHPENIDMNEHMKAMWAGQSNVLVSVRVRPLMKHDVVKKGCVRVLDSSVVVIMDPASGDKIDILRANRSREKQYAFDFVFEPGAAQEMVYNNTTKFLIHGVLDGYNATVFAYGQTGSGKTYTMIGTQSEPGIMVRVMEDLFHHSKIQGKKQGVQYKVTVSFLEVYNENIRDLLSDVEEYLDLREDPIKGPVVASITEIEATSSAEIMSLLHQGNAKRSQAATAANEVSSRSHAVLQVVVECRDRAPGTVANIKVGKLSLVDLAGSERAANTKNVGARLVEGANINRSLLALGNCINALGEKGNKGNFVPYRDSKLTRLLKDSLGGNCRTVMIANISSAESSFEETLNTLKYANRAKNIKTNVQRNVLNVNYHISEYVELINNLRSEIQVLKGQISSGPPPMMTVPGEHGHRVSTGHHLASHLGVGGGIAALGMMSPGGVLHPQGINNINGGVNSPAVMVGPSTPFQALRESLRSGTGAAAGGEGRELVNNMRQRIVENFQEKMQLRRSLIELEDQNVQNSIEVSKRQLLIVQWSEKHGNHLLKKNGMAGLTKADFSAYILSNGSPEIVEAWQECEQLRKAIIKNNGMKKNIAKRLRYNEKDAEKFREELSNNVTGEDRRELMALQYQVGRLELENMELEQHRIVHESILKGKDLVIQKLKLQLAVREKLINRQQAILQEHHLDGKVGYDQLALMEETLMGDPEQLSAAMVPPSPPRNMADLMPGVGHGSNGSHSKQFGQSRDDNDHDNSYDYDDFDAKSDSKFDRRNHGKNDTKYSSNSAMVPKLKINQKKQQQQQQSEEEEVEDDYDMALTERAEVPLTSRDRELEHGDWSEIHSELSDHSFSASTLNQGNNTGNSNNNGHHQVHRHRGSNKAAGNKGGSNKVSGPRGGRMYRASGGQEQAQPQPRLMKASSIQSQQVSDENSDDDSVSNAIPAANNNPGVFVGGKYRHYVSPRVNNNNANNANNSNNNNSSNAKISYSLDKLEPINGATSLANTDESGHNNNSSGGIIMSGRKFISSNRDDPSPRRDAPVASNAVSSNVTPLAANSAIASNNHNNNRAGNNNGNNNARQPIFQLKKVKESKDDDTSFLVAAEDKQHSNNNIPPNRQRGPYRNSRGQLENINEEKEKDAADVLFSDLNHNSAESNIDLVIKSKPLASNNNYNGRQPFMSNNSGINMNNPSSNNRVRVGGGITLTSVNSNSKASNNNAELPPMPNLPDQQTSAASSNDLNVMGSGFDGLHVVNANRPANNRQPRVNVRPGKPLLSSKLGSGVNSANVSNTNSEAALMINATAIGSVNPVIGASSNADCKDVGGGDGDDYKPSRVNSLPTLIKTNSGSSLLNTARQQEMNNLGAIFSDT